MGSGDNGLVDAGSGFPLANGDGGQSAGSLPFRRLDGGGGDGEGEVTRAFFSRGFVGVLDVLESADAADGSGVVSLGDSGELDLERGFGRFSVFGVSLVPDDGSGGDTVGRRGLCEPRRLRDVSASL